MDFNSLDLKHKRAVIVHVQFFRIAVNRLVSKLRSDRHKEMLIDEITAEANDFINSLSDEDVDEIIKIIETNLGTIIQ